MKQSLRSINSGQNLIIIYKKSFTSPPMFPTLLELKKNKILTDFEFFSKADIEIEFEISTSYPAVSPHPDVSIKLIYRF